MKKLLMGITLLILCGCVSTNHDYQGYLHSKGVMEYEVQSFDHCRGYGCRIIDRNLTLSERDWKDIAALFDLSTQTSETERQRIGPAIGLMEQKVGAMTGSEGDISGTYRKLGDDQHDCVDESVNTTIYLTLLKQKGLIIHHKIGAPTARIPILSKGLGPHQTAIIIDNDTEESYAVDSWFYDNGKPAEVVPLSDWFYGWRPAGAKIEETDKE